MHDRQLTPNGTLPTSPARVGARHRYGLVSEKTQLNLHLVRVTLTGRPGRVQFTQANQPTTGTARP